MPKVSLILNTLNSYGRSFLIHIPGVEVIFRTISENHDFSFTLKGKPASDAKTKTANRVFIYGTEN